MLLDDLTALGLSKNEATTYLALIEAGKSRAGEIIKSTKIHRNLIYTALDELVARGLATKTIVKGVAEYAANNPERLVDELKFKQELAVRVAGELKKKQEEEPREITIYEGMEGIKRSRNKVLSYPGDTFFIVGASSTSSTPEYERMWRAFHKKREDLKIKLKILFKQSTEKEILDWRNRLEHSQAKFLPFASDAPAWFAGIGDHLEIGIPGENPIVFNIKSKKAVEGLKKYFDYFWSQKVMALQEERGFQMTFGDMLDSLGPEQELQIMGIFEFDDEFAEKITDFHKKRSKKGIRAKLLLNIGAKKIGLTLSKLPHTKIKYLPESLVTPAVFLIYSNKTVISIPNQRTWFRIENTESTEAFRSYFNTLWKQN